MTEPDLREYVLDVDSKIVGVEPQPDERLTKALASAGTQLVRLDPPRCVVRVTAASESEAERQAVEALERWASGPGAAWSVAGVTQWEDG
jgi:hypothetical protein